MLQKIPTYDLFFKVNESPLRAIIENTMVLPERYKVLHENTRFLGIKEIEKETQKAFFVEHSHAYKCARVLAESISSNINQDRSYKNDLNNKAFIFLGSGNNTETRQLPKDSLFGDFDKHLIEQLRRYGFSPAIAVQNGYDYLDRTTFYLLAELAISESVFGYLTIAKYKFGNNTIYDALKNPLKKEDYCILDIKENGVPFFLKELRKFFETYESLYNIQANSEQLIAVALDIFNKNRNLESLKSDVNLADEMRKFISSARAYFDRKENLAHLINFIARLHYIDFSLSQITPSLLHDVLTEKKAYSNLPRIFLGKNQDPNERANYLAEQVNVYKLIPSV